VLPLDDTGTFGKAASRPPRRRCLQTLWACRPAVVEGCWSTPRALRGVRQVVDWALGRDHAWEASTVPNGMRWVGLGVHAHASAVAVFDDLTGEVITRRVSGRPWEVLGVLREPGRPVRAVYEAGPTGYGLVRRARAEGIEFLRTPPRRIAQLHPRARRHLKVKLAAYWARAAISPEDLPLYERDEPHPRDRSWPPSPLRSPRRQPRGIAPGRRVGSRRARTGLRTRARAAAAPPVRPAVMTTWLDVGVVAMAQAERAPVAGRFTSAPAAPGGRDGGADASGRARAR
jgi:hypothetical protein